MVFIFSLPRILQNIQDHALIILSGNLTQLTYFEEIIFFTRWQNCQFWAKIFFAKSARNRDQIEARDLLIILSYSLDRKKVARKEIF